MSVNATEKVTLDGILYLMPKILLSPAPFAVSRSVFLLLVVADDAVGH